MRTAVEVTDEVIAVVDERAHALGATKRLRLNILAVM